MKGGRKIDVAPNPLTRLLVDKMNRSKVSEQEYPKISFNTLDEILDLHGCIIIRIIMEHLIYSVSTMKVKEKTTDKQIAEQEARQVIQQQADGTEQKDKDWTRQQ